MTRRDILMLLFKWKGTLLVILTAVTVGAVAAAYLLPPSYRANTKVLVEIARAPVQRSTFVPTPETQEVMTTETEIILSQTVMAVVVDRLKPHERPQKPSVARRVRDSLAEAGLIEVLSPREQWIASLQRQVEAKIVANSSVINVRYSDGDPEWAARIANAVTDAYIEQHLRIFSQAKESELYRRQVAASDEALGRLRAELEDRKRRSSVAAIEDNRRALVQAAASLREQRLKASTDHADLTTRYEPDHEKVKLSASKIEMLERLITQTEQQLRNLDTAESGLKGVQLSIQVEEQGFRDKKRRYDDAKLVEGADINTVNVRVIDYADVPQRPLHSRLFLIGVSVAGGLVLAMLILLVREYFDRRVLNPQLAEQLLHVPELGSVPDRRRLIAFGSASSRRPLALAVSAGLLLFALGMLVYGPSRFALYLISTFPGASTGDRATSTESAAFAQRAVAIQGESLPAIPTSRRGLWPPTQQSAAADHEPTAASPLIKQSHRAASQGDYEIVSNPVAPTSSRTTLRSSGATSVAARGTGSAAACTNGTVALGLCPSAAGQEQPATQIRASTHVARPTAREPANTRCNEGAIALGLCTQ